MLLEWIQYFTVQKKWKTGFEGRSMYKIFNAAGKCGYLKDIDEPVDPRDAKKLQEINYLSVQLKPR